MFIIKGVEACFQVERNGLRRLKLFSAAGCGDAIQSNALYYESNNPDFNHPHTFETFN